MTREELMMYVRDQMLGYEELFKNSPPGNRRSYYLGKYRVYEDILELLKDMK